MASQDLIFPLLPRNTAVPVTSELDKVTQLQKKQRLNAVASEEESEAQHARIQERQKQQQGQHQQERQSNQQAATKTGEQIQTKRPIDPDSTKGQNLDIFA